MTSVLVLQIGLALGAVGALVALRPPAILGLSTRRRGCALLATGLLVAVAGALLPAPDRRSSDGRRIDDFLPVYQFVEQHTIVVDASADRVRAAIDAVTLEDIRLAQVLLAIRSLGRRRVSQEAARRPMLDAATSDGFVWLARGEREVVVGTVGRFWRLRKGESSGVDTPEQFTSFARPGWAKAAMDFVVVEEGAGRTRVSTETRVAGTDAAARRVFAAYWRVIYPGSALLRRMWLQAIRRRGEAAPP
jgi:hypothetical protein